MACRKGRLLEDSFLGKAAEISSIPTAFGHKRGLTPRKKHLLTRQPQDLPHLPHFLS